MKKIFTFLPFLLLALSVFAQAPQKMSYQAVIRNSSDALVSSTVVGMRISILQGSATGTPVYVETQTPTTNTNGLVSIEIGGGTIVTGTMGGINWATGAYFIKTETDPSGGTNYTITGTSQLMSVPFALYAASSGNLATTGANVGDMQYWNGTSWTNIPVGKPGQFLQLSTSNIPEWAGSAIPVVTTNTVTTLATNLSQAICKGSIVSDGVNNQEFSAVRGVCWSTSPSPTILNYVAYSSTNDKNPFTATLINLESEKIYYVRAFATNNTSTGYGKEVVYTTPKIPVPILTTTQVLPYSNIDLTSAKSGGEILNETNTWEKYKETGICWSTSPNPTINDFKSGGTGYYGNPFSFNLNNLVLGTTYYVRAYAINNSDIIGYGNELVYTPNIIVPIVSTNPITDVTGGTAISGGHILYEGGSIILQRGVCWSTSPNPTINDNKTSQGNGNVQYTSYISVLSLNTTYYVRAYAINSAGAGYGEQISFTTTSVLSVGNSYQGGLIGYILQSGDPGYIAGQTHGLIINSEDQGTASWGCQDTSIATQWALGSGNQNTVNIMNGCTTAGIAARICGDLVLNGYSDWYLASRDEWGKIAINSNYLNFNIPNDQFGAIKYWTSTERDSHFSYCLYISTTATYIASSYNKNDVINIRGVRSF
jgi:hypothetical protein